MSASFTPFYKLEADDPDRATGTAVVSTENAKHAQNTSAFLQLLALGDEDIRTGKTRPVKEFSAFMRTKLAGRKK